MLKVWCLLFLCSFADVLSASFDPSTLTGATQTLECNFSSTITELTPSSCLILTVADELKTHITENNVESVICLMKNSFQNCQGLSSAIEVFDQISKIKSMDFTGTLELLLPEKSQNCSTDENQTAPTPAGKIRDDSNIGTAKKVSDFMPVQPPLHTIHSNEALQNLLETFNKRQMALIKHAIMLQNAKDNLLYEYRQLLIEKDPKKALRLGMPSLTATLLTKTIEKAEKMNHELLYRIIKSQPADGILNKSLFYESYIDQLLNSNDSDDHKIIKMFIKAAEKEDKNTFFDDDLHFVG